MALSIFARASALLSTSTSADEQDAQEVHLDVDYAPLAADPEQADNTKMGMDDTLKQESRIGDTFAEAAAYVNFVSEILM